MTYGSATLLTPHQMPSMESSPETDDAFYCIQVEQTTAGNTGMLKIWNAIIINHKLSV
jgi:hypothetical protein